MNTSVTIFGTDNLFRLGLHPADLMKTLQRLMSNAFTLRPEVAPFAIELMVVRDAEMTRINEDSMGCTGPTNVLSFPALNAGTGFSNSPGLPVASLVLDVDAALREAFLYNEGTEHTILRLLSHAVGHLMGYDHSDEMFKFCDNILKYKD